VLDAFLRWLGAERSSNKVLLNRNNLTEALWGLRFYLKMAGTGYDR